MTCRFDNPERRYLLIAVAAIWLLLVIRGCNQGLHNQKVDRDLQRIQEKLGIFVLEGK